MAAADGAVVLLASAGAYLLRHGTVGLSYEVTSITLLAAVLTFNAMRLTGCYSRHVSASAAVQVGRAAQGRPWIFREIAHFLATGQELPPPSIGEVRQILLGHLRALHDFYGELQGVRIARKHLGWYVKNRPEQSAEEMAAFRAVVNRAETAEAQLRLTAAYFDALEAAVPSGCATAA